MATKQDGEQNECCGETGKHSVYCEYAVLKWQNQEDGYNISRLTAENQRYREALEQADEANRSARAVFRALDSNAFWDDEHESLIIAETVKKLEAVSDIAEAALGGE
jgi:hypothetical protein